MTENLPSLLLGLFAIHMVAFLVVWVRTRQAKYLLITFTFVFLVASYAFRVFAPEVSLGGKSAFLILRVIAWIMVAVSLYYSQVVLRRRKS